MRSLIIFGGAALLVLLTIAECQLDFATPVNQKQFEDCGDINDTSTDIGKCAEYVDFFDYESFCDADCVEVVEDWLNCYKVADSYVDDVVDDLKEKCNAVTAGAIFTVTVILVAIAAAMH